MLKTDNLIINKNFKFPVRSKLYATKPKIIRAIQMNIAFSVETPKGRIEGISGDYLFREKNGDLGIIKEIKFKETYDEFSIGSD